MLSGFMIPKINGLAKVFGPLHFGTDNKVIAATVLRDDEGVLWEAAPLAHSCCLSRDVVASASSPLPICGVEERNQPPVVSTHFHLAAVVLGEARLQAKRKRESGFSFGLCDLCRCDWKRHGGVT